jgi:hypothetical protein
MVLPARAGVIPSRPMLLAKYQNFDFRSRPSDLIRFLVSPRLKVKRPTAVSN